MRASEPTFWLLNGTTGWKTTYKNGVTESQKGGIRLAADPKGPLSLSSRDGSLGRLALPRGVTIDGEGILYLLVDAEDKGDGPRILRYYPEHQSFAALPWIGDYGHDARLFSHPMQIAALGDDLYVADTGNRRVQVFDLRSLALRYVWSALAGTSWKPVDVAAARESVYVLDQQNSRVFRHQRGRNQLEMVLNWEKKAQAKNWTRILVDREGRIYLLDLQDPESPVLDIFTADGKFSGRTAQAGDVRDRFDAPAIILDDAGRFCLPPSLASLCNRSLSVFDPDQPRPLTACLPDGKIFDRNGRLSTLEPDEPVGAAPYSKQGTWVAGPLDSKIYQCLWHRIELELSTLPLGSGLTVSTLVSADGLDVNDVVNQAPDAWQECFSAVGQFIPPDQEKDYPDPCEPEFLIQSPPGQYLWLKIDLHSDGFESPVIQSARLHYPRESYLNALPAIFSAEEESRRMLERYLAIAQTELDGLEAVIDDMPRLFDPESVPPGPFLAYLVSWLALPIEKTWTEEQKRTLLQAAPQLYARRGSPEVLRRFLRVYLQNISVQAVEQDAYPVLVEGFRQRTHFLLNQEDSGSLNHGAGLWSPAVIGRLQLDNYAREGEVRLVSTGDPQRDVFHHYAHRFRVYVPSPWIRTAEAERMFRRALEAEKPAHTKYELCLVEPRLRVGLQSTVGIDTIIGAYPQAQLACRDDSMVPASRPPRNRLGYDTVLAGGPHIGSVVHLAPGTRVGKDTLIN